MPKRSREESLQEGEAEDAEGKDGGRGVPASRGVGDSRTEVGHTGGWGPALGQEMGGLFHFLEGKEKVGPALPTSDQSDSRTLRCSHVRASVFSESGGGGPRGWEELAGSGAPYFSSR